MQNIAEKTKVQKTATKVLHPFTITMFYSISLDILSKKKKLSLEIINNILNPYFMFILFAY